ncbi:MAG: hypothetical protein RIC85_05050 [Gammaproteobacteria bacterium]|uniref:hypothetical protein n=1 Tax=Thalassobaculum sp. TaxID=2022740 RepID=UPI0032EE503A
MDALKAIADLKAAGMPERQACVLVRVIQQATGDGSSVCGEAVLTREALQEDIRRFGLEVSRMIDGESRFYVTCMIGMFAVLYVMLWLIP